MNQYSERYGLPLPSCASYSILTFQPEKSFFSFPMETSGKRERSADMADIYLSMSATVPLSLMSKSLKLSVSFIIFLLIFIMAVAMTIFSSCET